MNQSAEQRISPQEQIDGPSTLGHCQKEWSRDGMQEPVYPATTSATNSFKNNTATINVNTTPIVKAPVMVTASETSTTNATKARSEESRLDEQTEPASGYVSSSFTTPTFNVQSQVINCTKVQTAFAECYCDHEALCGICITNDLNMSTSLFSCLPHPFQVLRLDIYYALKESEPLA